MDCARKYSRYGHRRLDHGAGRLSGTGCERQSCAICSGIRLSWMQAGCTSGGLRTGLPSVHPIRGDEIRALRRLRRENPTSHVFVTERGGPFTTVGFHHLIKRLGEVAGMPFKVHPHMLRHACGFALANAGHDTRAIQNYLGHKNIQHTVRYTELSPDRFRDFWRD